MKINRMARGCLRGHIDPDLPSPRCHNPGLAAVFNLSGGMAPIMSHGSGSLKSPVRGITAFSTPAGGIDCQYLRATRVGAFVPRAKVPGLGSGPSFPARGAAWGTKGRAWSWRSPARPEQPTQPSRDLFAGENRNTAPYVVTSPIDRTASICSIRVRDHAGVNFKLEGSWRVRGGRPRLGDERDGAAEAAGCAEEFVR
jgi:hypothetical protein